MHEHLPPVPQLHDYLHLTSRRFADEIAIVCGSQRTSYRELEERSNALAHALARRGVGRGDRVLVFADNSADTAVAFFGVLKANAVACVVNPLTKSDKLAYLVADCRPRSLIVQGTLQASWRAAALSSQVSSVLIIGPALPEPAEKCEPLEAAIALEPRGAAPVRRNIDMDLAAIVYTSGSTGDPKGVMLTHRSMIAAATSISSYLELRHDDVILCVLPLAFDYGLYQLIMSVRMGARLVLERSFAFPSKVLARVVEEGVTGFPGVPTMFAMLGELENLRDFDLSKIRFVTNTGAALSEKHIHMLRDVFPAARIYSMYGLTECKRCTYLPPEDLDRKPGSVGIAIPNTELWLVDEHGERVGPSTVGQLVIRGATVMSGYWEKPEATAKKLKPGPLPGEHVLWTGDYCRLDEEGYLYFVSRMDDVIKSRGEKVAPKEVEAALCNIQGVREAAVVGVPDDLLGHAVKAYVVLSVGATLSERDIMRACHERLEPFMVPKYVSIVPDLPKTDSGKIRKTGLS